MNETSKFEPLQPVYGPYVQVSNEDEISLVDAWIALSHYKRAFWFTWIPLVLTGLVVAMFLFNERFTLTSAVQIGTYNVNNQVVALESTDSLSSKLRNVLIPAVTSEVLSENPQMDRFETRVMTDKGSDVVLIQHKVLKSQQDQFRRVQQRIAAAIVAQHDQKISTLQVDLEARLELERLKLAELQDPRSLQMALDKVNSNITAQQNKLTRLQENLSILQDGGPQKFLSILSPQEREQVVSQQETPAEVDDLIVLKFDKYLLENRIQQDEIQDAINTARIRLKELEKAQQDNINLQQQTIKTLEDKLAAFNRTRLVNSPVLSVEPQGLTRPYLVILVVLFASLAGFGMMLLMLFRDKVRERRETI